MEIVNYKQIKLTDKTLYKSTEAVSEDNLFNILNQAFEVEKWLQDKNAYAVAFNQLGFNYNCFVTKGNKLGLPNTIFINPFYIQLKKSKEIINTESCLSFPNKEFKIKRFKRIYFNYFDYLKDDNLSFKMNSIGAIICQHETDHLSGVTIKS